MKIIIPLKPGILALACAAVPLAGSAQQDDYSQALRELNIMSNIFAATLEQDRDRRFPAFGRSPESLYLAGQGMVFTFNLNSTVFRGNFGNYWQQFGADMSRIASEVMNEVSASFPDVDFDFDFDYDFEPGAVPAPPPAPGVVFINPPSGATTIDLREIANEQREVMQEMAEEMRDQQREVQELQRDLRELQRDLRNERGNVAGIEEEMRQLETRIAEETAALEAQREAYQRFIEEFETRRQEQLASLNQEMTNQVVTTLCDYGATLRSLENGEHVTLIFEDYAENQDQVYVFNYQDLAACNSAEELLAAAVSYRIPN